MTIPIYMEIVFTDGSTRGNGKATAKGGIGVYFPEHSNWNYSEPITSETFKKPVTNNLTELYSIKKAIEIAEYHNPNTKLSLTIYSDSKYCCDIFNSWAKTWEKNDWKKRDGTTILNKSLIQNIWETIKKHNICLKHCRSHCDEPLNKETEAYRIWYGNKMADNLATNYK